MGKYCSYCSNFNTHYFKNSWSHMIFMLIGNMYRCYIVKKSDFDRY